MSDGVTSWARLHKQETEHPKYWGVLCQTLTINSGERIREMTEHEQIARAWDYMMTLFKHDMPKAAYDKYVKGMEFEDYEPGQVVASVRDEIQATWLEERLYVSMCKILTGAMNKQIEVDFVRKD
jgi:hypothetical protein